MALDGRARPASRASGRSWTFAPTRSPIAMASGDPLDASHDHRQSQSEAAAPFRLGQPTTWRLQQSMRPPASESMAATSAADCHLLVRPTTEQARHETKRVTAPTAHTTMEVMGSALPSGHGLRRLRESGHVTPTTFRLPGGRLAP